MSQGWAAMGKPDFATCGKLFYRLPAELREGMNRSEEKVLIWTIFLSWTTAFRSGRGGALASFSETWIGDRFGRSRYTVMRALAKLEGWSLLKRIRRSPKKDGTYQTNLIALGVALTRFLGVTTMNPKDNTSALTARLTSTFGTKNPQVPEKSPCSKSAPQEVSNDYKREKVAVPSVSASHSLSLSAFQLRSRNERESLEAEKPVEKGTLTDMFFKILNRNLKPGETPYGLSTQKT